MLLPIFLADHPCPPLGYVQLHAWSIYLISTPEFHPNQAIVLTRADSRTLRNACTKVWTEKEAEDLPEVV